MMIIPLTRKSYHCLDGCLVFDLTFKNFKEDLKFRSQDFSVQYNNHFETFCDQ